MWVAVLGDHGSQWEFVSLIAAFLVSLLNRHEG